MGKRREGLVGGWSHCAVTDETGVGGWSHCTVTEEEMDGWLELMYCSVLDAVVRSWNGD